MAVGTGAGALNATKPVTVNDMMEAIQPPGLKPLNGSALLDLTANVDSYELCSIGGAGYTEVVDDIIIEIVDAVVGANIDVYVGVTGSASEFVGLTSGAGRISAADATAGKLFSVLRGNLPNSATWSSTANTEALRTYGPGSGESGQTGATAVLLKIDEAGGSNSAGSCRVWIRSHYTDVTFGPGL